MDVPKMFVAKAIFALAGLGSSVLNCQAYTWRYSGVESDFLVTNDRVLFTQSDGSLTVLNLGTGDVLRRDRSRYFSGTFISTPPGILIVGYESITLLDPSTYKTIWTVDSQYDATVSDGRLISDDGNGQVQCRNLTNGSPLWTFDLPGALQVVAEGNTVVVNRAATYDKPANPVAVALNIETGKEIFRKMPPSGSHWAKIFFDGTNIYVEKGSYQTNRSDFSLEEMLVWNARGEKVKSIAFPPEWRNSPSFRYGDSPFDLDKKTFWNGRVYSGRNSIPRERMGKLAAVREMTNDVFAISESEYDLDGGVTLVERIKRPVDASLRGRPPETEIAVKTPRGQWTGVIPYRSNHGYITTLARAEGKILIGTDLSEVECIDADTGASKWLYIFPILRKTMSFSSYGLPPMMSTATAIFEEDNSNPPQSGLQLVEGVSSKPRIIFDPDPVRPFRRLHLYLTICWGAVMAPLIVLILIHMRPRLHHWGMRGSISAVLTYCMLFCFMFYGRVSPGSSIGLRVAILFGLAFGIFDTVQLFRRRNWLKAAVLSAIFGALALLIFPFLGRV